MAPLTRARRRAALQRMIVTDAGPNQSKPVGARVGQSEGDFTNNIRDTSLVPHGVVNLAGWAAWDPGPTGPPSWCKLQWRPRSSQRLLCVGGF